MTEKIQTAPFEKPPSFQTPESYLHALAAENPEQVPAYKTVLELASTCSDAGGRALLVGGSVRDSVLGRLSKDFDLEIYGLELEQIEELSSRFGTVNTVGRSFGILKLSKEGIDIDISLPRSDSKVGEGHRGFAVTTDPDMSIAEAAKRRDFTMNALAADPLTGEIFDYHGGIRDLQHRILRVTDAERFQDDPLRVMRGLQFVSRFGLQIDPDTAHLMQEMAPQLRELPRERLGEEWKKLLLKSPKPSLGLAAGMALGIFEHIHPELPPLAETPQEAEWHPEGDVWVHTLMVLDEAARLIKQYALPDEEALVVMFGALSHDFGKPMTTEFIDGKIRSRGHEPAGRGPTEAFLSTMGIEGVLKEKVAKIVEHHLAPSMLFTQNVLKEKSNEAADGALRRLAGRIHPATIRELALVATADHYGRGIFTDPQIPEQLMLNDGYPAGRWLLERARILEVERSTPSSLIKGRDLLAFGITPGKHVGDIIKLADRLRDEKKFTREDVLMALQEHTDHYQMLEHLTTLLDN